MCCLGTKIVIFCMFLMTLFWRENCYCSQSQQFQKLKLSKVKKKWNFWWFSDILQCTLKFNSIDTYSFFSAWQFSRAISFRSPNVAREGCVPSQSLAKSPIRRRSIHSSALRQKRVSCVQATGCPNKFGNLECSKVIQSWVT